MSVPHFSNDRNEFASRPYNNKNAMQKEDDNAIICHLSLTPLKNLREFKESEQFWIYLCHAKDGIK